MDRDGTRRAFLAGVAAATAGVAGCVERQTVGDPDETTDPANATDGTRTSTTGPSPTETPPSFAGERPAVVDLDVSRRLGAVAGSDDQAAAADDRFSAYEVVAAEYASLVVEDQAYAPRPSPLDEDTVTCQTVPTHRVRLTAARATPPEGATVTPVESFGADTREAIRTAIETGSYSTGRLGGGVGPIESPDGDGPGPVPESLPPLSYVRDGDTYVLGEFRWQSPSCTVAVHEFTFEPTDEPTGPVVHAVDATGGASEAVAGALDGGFEGSGAPPSAVRRVAAFDFAAAVDRRQVTYYRPTLSVATDGYRFDLDPVLSGTVGP